MYGTRMAGSGGTPGRRRRRWTPGTLPLFVALVGLSLLGVPGAAFAEPTAAATPAPTPAPTSERDTKAAPTNAPAIVSPPPGSFVGSGTTTVSGTGEAGREIRLLSPVDGQDPLCFAVVDGAGQWSCAAVSLPSGPSVPLRVVVTGAADLTDEHTIAVLSAPRVTGGPTGGSLTNGTVRGTGYPGASVVITVSGGPRCTATADSSGNWSCTFADGLAGGQAEVSASQQTSYSNPSWSNSSAPVDLVFDLDRPAPPTLTTPASGAQLPLTDAGYMGTGEEGATVTVFAGSYSVCSAVVASGSWSCSAGGVAAGTFRVIAVQLDLAGNLGPGSPGVDVLYGVPTPSPSGSTGPEATAPSADAPAAPPPAEESAPAEAPPGSAAPASPAPQADRPAVALATPLPGGWNDPTRFATAVLPPWSTPDLSWFQAALLALGALLLLCIPARLLAGTVFRATDGHPLWQSMPIAGRNRSREEFETVPELPLNRWLVAGAAVLAAATLVMLSGPVTSQPAYLRLLLAVALALLIVNAVGALVPLWWSSRVWRTKASVTFLPRYLLLVALTALASRAFDVHPALVFGLLGSVTVAPEVLTPRRGPLAAVRAGSLIGLAVVGWLTLGLLPAADGFLSALAAEIINSVVLAAIGSAALVLIPIGRTSGRSILAWSPPIWACLTVLAFTIMFGVLSPAVELWHEGGSLSLWWVAGTLFAALSIGAWAWQRFVTPARV
ncbi:hypothetical protein [Cryobacterium sp. M96]|uniref:hypothetical protein n=1 Tax=Cryobacterium sp. M96 TaxID=2048295 RepID=UPI0013048692|nr:hypothetical protein [Cryobacterium sp. M96]